MPISILTKGHFAQCQRGHAYLLSSLSLSFCLEHAQILDREDKGLQFYNATTANAKC
jgi:hypothetical protein